MPFLISGIPQRGAPGPYCFDLIRIAPCPTKAYIIAVHCITLIKF